MIKYYSTKQISKFLRIQPDRIQKAIWTSRFKSPVKSPAGNYLWTVRDIERAAWALHRWPEFKAWRDNNG